MEAINLDLLPGAIPPIVHVSQGDVGRKFVISIYDDTGAAYSLTGKNISIVGHKEDGNVFQYNISSSAVSNNTVTITTEEQMTTTAGKVICEIRIEYDGTKLGTCNFVMDVEQGPADLGIVSKSTLYFIDVLFEKAKEYTDAAAASAATASQKATEAANSATNAASSARSADSSATAALNSARDAATYASNASYYMSEAQQYSETAKSAANNASSSADEASVSANDAADSASSASNYMSSARQYSEAAGNSATNAASSANVANAHATNAATSAANAESSEQSAREKADTALSSANNAANSASSASTSANNAATSATAAAKSATAAESSEQVATEKANIASTSATNAAKSASAASTSANNAAASANAAATSETNAESSEQIATEKANTASTSATNAANSASAASTSETNAAKSATAAAKSSEDASAKASAANQSAINAASSKDSAATSATAAEAAKNRIENMTVSAQSVPYTSQAEVTKSIVNDVVNLDFKIPKGQPMSGHEVVANPAGSATGGDLTKLDIDGTVYNVSGIPDYSQASDGDVLTKTAQGPAWSAPSGGGGSIELPKFESVRAYGQFDNPKYTYTSHMYWLKGDGTNVGDIFVAMVEYIPESSDQLECPLYNTKNNKVQRISNTKYQSLFNFIQIPRENNAEGIINKLCMNTPSNICIGSTLYNSFATNKFVFSPIGTPVLGNYFDQSNYSIKFAYYIGGVVQSTNVNIENNIVLDNLGIMANINIFDA